MNPTIVVPIKSHSERLKDKNFIQLGGQPLYRWTFDSLIPYADKVLVVVDDPFIQDEAQRFGFDVRGREPSWEEITAWDVALLAAPKDPVLALALVTCPFRRKGDVEEASRLFKKLHYAPVISAVQANWKSVILCDGHGTRMADALNAFISTGVIQIALRESIVDGHINRDGAAVYQVPAVVGLDIDTPLDWCAAFGVVETVRGAEIGREVMEEWAPEN